MSADFWAGYLSGAAGILIGNPLDLVKVRLQAGAPASLAPASAARAAPPAGTTTTTTTSPPPRAALVRTVTALATGAAAPVLGYGALNALLFVSYRQAEAVLTTAPTSTPSLTTTWLAGAVAGLATWVVSAPTELIKCRAQLAGSVPSAATTAAATTTVSTPLVSSSSPPSSSSSWAVARRVWRTAGIRGFFLGGTVTALRDSVGYGFYFWSYKLATDAWREAVYPSLSSSSAPTPPSAAATLLCGGLAGIVTWASVFPLDVIKTRVQAQAWDAPQRQSTWAVARQAYRTGGAGVFFRGLGVCSARAFVVNAVQWAVYEWLMRELTGPAASTAVV
ncbi:NADPH oxidase [Niveomyces insectorum RCEF 264]|uniref:NADPH oxidase n=1 Tax=Niveomyces insectorum RCEF 264 TaxID=1081102 RepID=A0A167SEJ0_9HYPO|nr:NADPH oxidase [Niveomyces insectorum RCEF 264]